MSSGGGRRRGGAEAVARPVQLLLQVGHVLLQVAALHPAQRRALKLPALSVPLAAAAALAPSGSSAAASAVAVLMSIPVSAVLTHRSHQYHL